MFLYHNETNEEQHTRMYFSKCIICEFSYRIEIVTYCKCIPNLIMLQIPQYIKNDNYFPCILVNIHHI